ncbi:MAG: hypothetical protein IPK83_19645 [Planctomycetes bacterium]|nr:hypothetical protein [Planctomycetota bacterium]
MARRRVKMRRVAPIVSEATLDLETLSQIEELLKNWNAAPDKVKKRFAHARRHPVKKLESQINAIAESEQLTEADFAIRINTRD